MSQTSITSGYANEGCTNMKCLPNNGDEGGRLGSILKGIHEGVQGNIQVRMEDSTM